MSTVGPAQPGAPLPPPPNQTQGRSRDGAGAGPGGDLSAGVGGRQAQGGGAQGQQALLARADRFAAALDGATPAAPARPAPANTETETGTNPGTPQGTALTAQPAPAAPTAEPAPLLPAGTATAEAVADITRRVAVELRAAEQPGGPLAAGGTLRLALDLGRTALGISGLRLDIGPQSLVLVLTVPPGGAAHDLPQAVQALAQALAARHPHRSVRIDLQGAERDEPATAPGFDPLRPWASRGHA